MNLSSSFRSLSLAVVLATAATVSKAAVDPVDCVNPFIGTAAHGHTYPGATMPFGMVQLSPDTFTHGWDWCSGYHWSDSSLLGFSHAHLSGTGCPDLGDVLVVPTVGKINLVPGTREEPEKGYRSRFSHTDEKASPGYYSVILKTPGVFAELTATKRVGFHRYTFPKSEEANIIFDLVHGIGDKPIAIELNIVGDRIVTGMRRSAGWAKDQYVFFAAEFSKPFTTFGTATNETQPQVGSRRAEGKKVKGWVTFTTAEREPVLLKVALSTTSIEGAMRNLKAEAPDWNFDSVRAASRTAWRKALSKVTVDGAKKDAETFYTALYHATVAPTLISDVDGQYRGSDGQVHKAEGFDNYSTFSLWDTFRAEQPLFTLIEPARVNDMIKAFQVQAEFHKDKTLPIWPLYANETYCMIGYHSFPVIAEAYAKGIRKWDAQAMFELMVNNTRRNDWWAETGYIPADKEHEAVSKTLEFAYDDWALAQFAKALGKNAEYEKFMKRAAAFRNLYDRESGFMRGRLADGSWRKPFRPTAVNQPGKPHDYTEGNAWQHTWFAPHDVAGLIELMGGREAFVKKLDGLFEHPPVAAEDQVPDVSGVIGQYAHGNEPSHHVAYLYAYAGAPWKTQERVRKICSELYTNTPEGVCGNEDCGQMSAWYVFSALGFYPVNPAQATYVFGLPVFKKAVVKLATGKAFTVLAKNLSTENCYVERVLLNGKELPRVYLKHQELTAGGTLEFVMTNKPGSKWATDPQAAPPSMSDKN